MLFVKQNQPSLYNEIVCLPSERFSPAHVETCKGHGRIETRTTTVAATPNGLVEFPHVKAVVRVERHTLKTKTSKTSDETPQRGWEGGTPCSSSSRGGGRGGGGG